MSRANVRRALGFMSLGERGTSKEPPSQYVWRSCAQRPARPPRKLCGPAQAQIARAKSPPIWSTAHVSPGACAASPASRGSMEQCFLNAAVKSVGSHVRGIADCEAFRLH
jgi:hypothetical protein